MKRKFSIAVLIVMVLFAQSAISQDFESYWKQFKSAVKSDDINTVCDLTNFPFEYGWLNPNERLSKNMFIEKNCIPSVKIVNMAKFKQEVKTKKDKDGFVKTVAFGKDGYDYVLSFTEWNEDEGYGSWSDYYFKIINGVYTYYKLVNGD